MKIEVKSKRNGNVTGLQPTEMRIKKILSKKLWREREREILEKFDKNRYEECKQNSNSMQERIMNGGQK